jgi:hypothetical protein
VGLSQLPPPPTGAGAGGMIASTSTLSSRAPAFEPGKRAATAAGFGHGLRISTNTTTNPAAAATPVGAGTGSTLDGGATTGVIGFGHGRPPVGGGPGGGAGYVGSGRR